MNEENLKICLGAKIKEYRNKLKLTQDELAEKINRTQGQVSLIELGKSFPNPETLLNVAKVFNCDIKELFDFREKNSLTWTNTVEQYFSKVE